MKDNGKRMMAQLVIESWVWYLATISLAWSVNLTSRLKGTPLLAMAQDNQLGMGRSAALRRHRPSIPKASWIMVFWDENRRCVTAIP